MYCKSYFSSMYVLFSRFFEFDIIAVNICLGEIVALSYGNWDLKMKYILQAKGKEMTKSKEKWTKKNFMN